MKEERKSNFELLRIISMLMIITWHIIVHGNVLANTQNPILYFLVEILKFIIIIHVNLFVLITGYFNCKSKFKLKKSLKLVLESVFYYLAICIIFQKIGLVKFSAANWIRNIFVNSYQDYWFLSNYIVLYFLSPYINKFINNSTQKEHKRLLLIMLILFSMIPYLTGNKESGSIFSNNGYTLYNFTFLYIIGAYFRLYPLKNSYHFKKMSTKKYRIVLILICFCSMITNYLLYKTSFDLSKISNSFNEVFENFNIESTNYENPFIILQAVSFFLFFETLNIKNSKIINRIASTTLGIYMIHDNTLIRGNIYRWLKINNGPIYSTSFIFYILLSAIIIFAVCMIIDFIRQFLVFIIKKTTLYKWLRSKISNALNDF